MTITKPQELHPPSCTRFENVKFEANHQSCDETNCNSLQRQLLMQMEGAVAEQCRRFIKVEDSCKRNEECKTHANIQSIHPRQTVVAYVSMDAENKLYHDYCGNTRGAEMVVTGDYFARTPFQNLGCAQATGKAIQNLMKRLDSKKGREISSKYCHQFIVARECVQYI